MHFLYTTPQIMVTSQATRADKEKGSKNLLKVVQEDFCCFFTNYSKIRGEITSPQILFILKRGVQIGLRLKEQKLKRRLNLLPCP